MGWRVLKGMDGLESPLGYGWVGESFGNVSGTVFEGERKRIAIKGFLDPPSAAFAMARFLDRGWAACAGSCMMSSALQAAARSCLP